MAEQLSLSDVLEAFMYQFYESCLSGVDTVKQYLSPNCRLSLKVSSFSSSKETEAETVVGPENIAAKLKEVVGPAKRAEIISWTPQPREDVCTLVTSVLWKRDDDSVAFESSDVFTVEVVPQGKGRRVFSVVAMVCHVVMQN